MDRQVVCSVQWAVSYETVIALRRGAQSFFVFLPTAHRRLHTAFPRATISKNIIGVD